MKSFPWDPLRQKKRIRTFEQRTVGIYERDAVPMPPAFLNLDWLESHIIQRSDTITNVPSFEDTAEEIYPGVENEEDEVESEENKVDESVEEEQDPTDFNNQHFSSKRKYQTTDACSNRKKAKPEKEVSTKISKKMSKEDIDLSLMNTAKTLADNV